MHIFVPYVNPFIHSDMVIFVSVSLPFTLYIKIGITYEEFWSFVYLLVLIIRINHICVKIGVIYLVLVLYRLVPQIQRALPIQSLISCIIGSLSGFERQL
jgi:hypothetical protein